MIEGKKEIVATGKQPARRGSTQEKPWDENLEIYAAWQNWIIRELPDAITVA